MLLGVFLHASLAYFDYPWPVQDAKRSSLLQLCYAAIHGFRMPLFFLLSGFFSMLLLRRRGLRALLTQRALRIVLPFMLAAATILPLDNASIYLAVAQGSKARAARSPLTAGILANDGALVQASLREHPDLEAWDPASGLTPLGLAARGGNTEVILPLLDAGASVDRRDRLGGTPLHSAAFMGNANVVELLLERGADPAVTNAAGQTAVDAIDRSASIAVKLRQFLGLPPTTVDAVERGREAVRRRLSAFRSNNRSAHPLDRIASRYQAALSSPRFTFDIEGFSLQLFDTPVLHHLWFLWYLGWMIAALAIADLVGMSPGGRHRWWLIAVTCLPASLMWSPFGPDTPLGILPTPHLLLYYLGFFWFGAASYAAGGTATRLGKHWRVVLPLSLIVVFPAAIATIGNRPLAALLQTTFAWSMSLGLIGLFHAIFNRDRPWVRWLSDASYWVYLTHLPLVIAMQAVLVDHDLPAAGKVLIVFSVTAATTLLTYRWCVRYTLIGLLLNGPRSRLGQLADCG